MTTAPEFEGRLFLPQDEEWDDARVGRMFNGRRPNRQPEAVLNAASVADVQKAVSWAKDCGWKIAVRAGGHSWAGWSVRDGGLLIDLGAFRDMSYDDETGIVTAGPATKGGDELSPFLEAQGRFFNGGHCPSVGIGGFLLQGGQGWNQRGWGWAAESVVAIDVVTADGELVRADAEHNSDLFWAARGAGPTFPGIVTAFHLQTRPMFAFLGHTVQAYELDRFSEVMTWLYRAQFEISTDVEIVAVSTKAQLPNGQVRRVFLVTGVALVNSREEAEEALEPFNTCPLLDEAIFVDHCRESSMDEQRRGQTEQNPEREQYLCDNLWVDGPITDDGIAAMVEGIRPLFTTNPTDHGFAIWMSNAPMRELPDMAFSMQSEAYVASYTVYEDPADESDNREWLNSVMAHAQPVTKGQYLGDSDMTNRQVKFMSDEHWARLKQIIEERDPEGRFHRFLAADWDTVNVHHWEL